MTDLERWRGEISSTVAAHERRLSALNGSIDKLRTSIEDQGIAIARIATRVSVFAAIAAFLGAGAITGLSRYLFH